MSGNDKKQPHAGQIGTLSESLEDYLEIILDLQQLKRVARIRDIAARKGVASASVSGAYRDSRAMAMSCMKRMNSLNSQKRAGCLPGTCSTVISS